MLTEKYMIESLTDKLAAGLGGLGGVIASMTLGMSTGMLDFLIKLLCTIVFAAIGATISFFIKRILEKKYKQ